MYSVVAIFKDEAPYLAEWIMFHRLQGFDNFLLYDNGSSDDGPKIAEGLGADVIEWPGKVRQLDAYHDAMRTLPAKTWAAFIDIDEYLWCPTGTMVTDMVENRFSHRWTTIAVPWYLFGDSGWKERPGPPFTTIDAYTHREQGPNVHFKTICRVSPNTRFLDPHHTNAHFRDSVHADDSIICNHYWSRSEPECMAKFARGRADLNVKREMKEFYDTQIALNAVEDRRLAEMMGPALRHQLFMNDGTR